MRLYNMYYLCKSSLDYIKNIKLEKKKFGQTGEYDYQIVNGERLFACYKSLTQIEFLKEDIEQIFKTLEVNFDLPIDMIEMTPMVANQYSTYRKSLITKMEFIVKFYESLKIKETSEGIDVKIPKCNSFNEYIKYMKDIEFILNQCPLISQCDETIDFENVDIGSMWICFFIKAKAGSHIILNTISKMVDIALKIRLNTIVSKQQEEILDAMHKKNEISAEVLDGYKKMKRVMLDKSVCELETECGKTIESPEDRDKTARSLEVMSELLDKGVEIYSAIEVPKQIRDKFPIQEDTLQLPDDIQKLIEQKDGGTDKKFNSSDAISEKTIRDYVDSELKKFSDNNDN